MLKEKRRTITVVGGWTYCKNCFDRRLLLQVLCGKSLGYGFFTGFEPTTAPATLVQTCSQHKLFLTKL